MQKSQEREEPTHEVHDKNQDDYKDLSMNEEATGIFHGCEGRTTKLPIHICKARNVKGRFIAKIVEFSPHHRVLKALRGSTESFEGLLLGHYNCKFATSHFCRWGGYAEVVISDCFDFLINKHLTEDQRRRLQKDPEMAELFENASADTWERGKEKGGK